MNEDLGRRNSKNAVVVGIWQMLRVQTKVTNER